jgi:hypothetical protein
LEHKDNHGDYVVTLCVKEEIKDGKKQASCIVIGHPNTHPDDVPHLKAMVEAAKASIVSPTTKKGFLECKDGWLKLLTTQKDVFNTNKLSTTLKKLTTKLNKRVWLKTTNITVRPEEGEIPFELSNAVFNDGAGPGELNMLLVPHTMKQHMNGKDQEVTLCILYLESLYWRNQGWHQGGQEKKAATSDYNLMVKLMAGTKITNWISVSCTVVLNVTKYILCLLFHLLDASIDAMSMTPPQSPPTPQRTPPPSPPTAMKTLSPGKTPPLFPEGTTQPSTPPRKGGDKKQSNHDGEEKHEQTADDTMTKSNPKLKKKRTKAIKVWVKDVMNDQRTREAVLKSFAASMLIAWLQERTKQKFEWVGNRRKD